ncbi:DNA polymerase III subunit alpha [Lentilactobacillus senioris]|uniref:DNA polymerase III subunit alpha n=1 Tax=Lentilactobacillus senioris TaxID=931534 RepID=UPI00227E3F78|nr:DNA polymerase III subunit alpha [Lentilactobacillus senioris]MCY9806803.1 DNA polymerase III subunit alpha [Lentilactobacillus senioris]
MTFVPLQLISSYSLLQSPIKINDLIQIAKQRGYQALALTDINVMYGAVEFYDACVAADIKPIIGLTLEVANQLNLDRSTQLVLVAKNQQGYQNLMLLSSRKLTTDEFEIKDLKDHLAGLAVIVAEQSEFYDDILRGQTTEAEQFLYQLQELSDSTTDILVGSTYMQPANIIQTVATIAAEVGSKVVAFKRVEYLNADDYFAQRVLTAIDSGNRLTEITTLAASQGLNWLQPARDEVINFEASGIKAGLTNLSELVASIQLEMQKQVPILPQFNTPDNVTAGDYLAKLCERGLLKRLKDNQISNSSPYFERLTMELTVIAEMQFNDYFLIVWDIIRFAHQQHILTGPGRGSAAGSLVAYCLGITDVDPLKYDLLFERFLNPERNQMPDIDIDLPDDRRDEVIQYLHTKYGHDRTGQIITFGTLAAKQALRDVSRSFGLSVAQQDQWSKAIPNALHISLSEAYANSQRLKNLVADSAINKLIFETAQKLEGLPRHYSTHAAGIVLSQHKLVEQVPVQNGNDGLLMTQYSKNYVELVGLLKIDLLGLRNLTTLADTLNNVKLINNQIINPTAIPLDDSQTIALFQQGKTDGIFQFESQGIRRALQEVDPQNFEEIALVNALYRPGPMQNIPQLVKRKQDGRKLKFNVPQIEPILAPTFGIIVYQEQVMLVASAMAGFSLGEADLLRRAMSKKNLAAMDQERDSFINGSVANGVERDRAVEIFAYIEKFANYGFNKSHAIAYSKMAYEQAYLKAHFPAAFYVALLNSVQNNDVKIKQYLNELKILNIGIKGPDINQSQERFGVIDHQIIFGLSAIKRLRKDTVKAILEERTVNGDYTSFANLITRLPEKFRNSDQIEILIYSGALDSFGYNRAELLAATPEFISSAELSGQSIELLTALMPKIKKRDELELAEKLQKENELLGAYLSGHPVEKYNRLLRKLNAVSIPDLVVGSQVTVGIYLTKVKVIRTKKGSQMAFLAGNDSTGDIDITIFPQLYSQVSNWLHRDMVVVISGRVEERQGLQIIADQITPAANLARKLLLKEKQWFVRVTKAQLQPKLTELAQIAVANQGTSNVVLIAADDHKTTKLNDNFNLATTKKVQSQLERLFGKDNVALK